LALELGPLRVRVFSKKTAQSKKSPDRRKFAQSGHPDLGQIWPLQKKVQEASNNDRFLESEEGGQGDYPN
jgi:hypothetical protein